MHISLIPILLSKKRPNKGQKFASKGCLLMKVMIDRSNNYFQEIKTDQVKMKADMISTRTYRTIKRLQKGHQGQTQNILYKLTLSQSNLVKKLRY